MKRTIVTAPNPILSQPAKEINKLDSQVLSVIEEMKVSLNSAKDPEGVGLAAPQIGKSLRIFIAKPNPKGKILVFVNPKILSKSEPSQSFTKERKVASDGKSKRKKKEVQKLEGCLSLKDIWGTVLRSPKVKLSYMDEAGKTYVKDFSGFLATIVQHESDHLDGILFPRRVLEQKGKLYKSERDEKGEDVFEEIEL